MIRLGILGSTRGTHLLAIIDAIQTQVLPAAIAVVASNKADALILSRAEMHHLPAVFIDPTGLTREAYDAKITEVLKAHDVDLVVLIGYMRIVSNAFVQTWQNRIINIHPSLLPAYAGMMDLKVHQAVLDAGETQSGCTVHYVTEEVDAGPIVLQATCPVVANDTAETLKAKVQALESKLLIQAIQKIAQTIN